VKAPEIRSETVTVWGGRLKLGVQVAGTGPAVVYLHPAAGLAWDPFLARLAERRTVYAPEFPGTSAADRQAVHAVEDVWDVVLCYEEALRALGLDRPAVLGQSFGGMLAAELAATFPKIFSRLVLLDPIGIWREDAPIWNWMTAPPAELPARLFHDPSCPGAQAMFTPPPDPDRAIAAQAGLVWALGCTGKFIWPIPDRGLAKRLHRVEAPTLVVWGENDRLIPAVYAEEFATRIRGSQVELIPGSGHVPQLEQPEKTWAAVSAFLGV
jgi:pimeloyl-ACP methyl ester carboxylesterase